MKVKGCLFCGDETGIQVKWGENSICLNCERTLKRLALSAIVETCKKEDIHHAEQIKLMEKLEE